MVKQNTTIPNMGKQKRGRGRPTKADSKDSSVTGRVPQVIREAVNALADIRRRSMSAEIGINTEDLVLNGEAELRLAGQWNEELEAIKRLRRPGK